MFYFGRVLVASNDNKRPECWKGIWKGYFWVGSWWTNVSGIPQKFAVHILAGGCFFFFQFSTVFMDMIQFDEHVFQMGWFNHQLVIVHIYTYLHLYIFSSVIWDELFNRLTLWNLLPPGGGRKCRQSVWTSEELWKKHDRKHHLGPPKGSE